MAGTRPEYCLIDRVYEVLCVSGPPLFGMMLIIECVRYVYMSIRVCACVMRVQYVCTCVYMCE